MENRILKAKQIRWKDLKPLQHKSFKEITPFALQKLKESFIRNNFVDSFFVWEEAPDLLWCLDGVHRIKVLEILELEGWEIPEYFPATFVACANRQEAAEMVLIFSSYYARVSEPGIKEFIGLEGLSANDLKAVLLPAISVEGIFEPDGIVVDEIQDEFNKDIIDLNKKKTEFVCKSCGFRW